MEKSIFSGVAKIDNSSLPPVGKSGSQGFVGCRASLRRGVSVSVGKVRYTRIRNAWDRRNEVDSSSVKDTSV